MSTGSSYAGHGYATGAYLIWGLSPIYFVWVGFALPLEILAQRIVWSIPLLALLAIPGRQWRALASLRSRDYAVLAVCAVLLSMNWLTFIYGVSQQKIAQTSLGYFMNPILTIALGAIFLGERQRLVQWIAVAVAASGVLLELFYQGELPWIAISLALTFGFYGLLRKQLAVPAFAGLAVETGLLAPLALLYLYAGEAVAPLATFLEIDLAPARTLSEHASLAAGGLVTAIPLLCFAAAASRLPMSTLGFFQYLAPTLSLLIAVIAYQEPISGLRWISFGLVWMAILIYLFENLHQRHQNADEIR